MTKANMFMVDLKDDFIKQFQTSYEEHWNQYIKKHLSNNTEP